MTDASATHSGATQSGANHPGPTQSGATHSGATHSGADLSGADGPAGGVPTGSVLHATLRARGYRLTPQRQLVLDAVTRLDHGTPDEICTEVQRTATGVNLSTVYRTLELLEQLGMVTHTHLGHGAPTYHPASSDDHLHLVCQDCGAVTEAGVELAEALVSGIAEQHGFATDVAHFAIYGRCKGCQS